MSNNIYKIIFFVKLNLLTLYRMNKKVSIDYHLIDFKIFDVRGFCTMIQFANLLYHDVSVLANLVYETDSIIPFIFGKRETALSKIKLLIEGENSSFSYRNMIVFQDDYGIVKGLLLAYTPKKRDKNKEKEEIVHIFSGLDLLILWFKSLLLNSIENKSEINGLYIQNISVNKASRGEGIGTKLMNYIEAISREKDEPSLWLDVAFDNLNAKRLYERQGFEVVSKNKIFLSKNGFFRMRKSLIESNKI